jgi:hypothetical protein
LLNPRYDNISTENFEIVLKKLAQKYGFVFVDKELMNIKEAWSVKIGKGESLGIENPIGWLIGLFDKKYQESKKDSSTNGS